MKIGIDCRFWDEAGIGRYIRNLVFNLALIDSKNKYFLFLLRKNLGQSLPKNFNQIEANFLWYGLEEQIKLPFLLRKYNLDLVHFPHFNVPIFYGGKYVVTIHDLIHQHQNFQKASTHGKIAYKIKELGYKKVFGNALKRSERIITPTEFVRNQLVKEWRVSEDKARVIYEAVESQLIAIAMQCDSNEQKKILEKFNITPPFVFYVGNAHPHKNVKGLIKAFGHLEGVCSVHLPDAQLKLVLSGNDNYFWQRIRKEYEDEHIIYTGYVTDEELVALYKASQAYIFPSFEEGFGIPLLEAMACGTPVLASNIGALKEVGGDAAVYFDPYDIDDMEEKISEVLNDQKLRGDLIKKGKIRVKDFSWEKLAEETLSVYCGV